MEYRYTIIDSNAATNLQLQHFLEEYGDFACVGIAGNDSEGLNQVLKHKPDLVFLSLNDQAEKHFQMVMEMHQYLKELPILIGISKTKTHAYTALKNHFFDYWLTPFNEFEIRKSLLGLKKTSPVEPEVPQTICLQSYRDFQYIDTNDILYLRADNNTTEFVMKDGTVNNAYKTLKTFENSMPENFVRIHQSYIVNVNYVSRINYGKALCSLKPAHEQLPFSKSYRSNVDYLKRLLSRNTIPNLN